jgi:hypothetical protein
MGSIPGSPLLNVSMHTEMGQFSREIRARDWQRLRQWLAFQTVSSGESRMAINRELAAKRVHDTEATSILIGNLRP